MYKLLIVDDEPLVRRGIATLVDFEKLDIEAVFEAGNGADALALFQEHLPDLVLLDINMPKMGGLEFAQKAKQLNPGAKIAIITGYDYFDYAVNALKIGIDDYVLKPVSKTDVVQLLTRLIQGLEQEARQKALAQVASTLIPDAAGAKDTGYRDTIRTIVDAKLGDSGFSLTVLAEELGFSPGYLSGLFKKTFGAAFQDYVLGRRLDQAKLMLLATELKNYEIAEAVGFEDANYFNTRFKKQYGLSPQQYRRKMRDGHGEN